MSKYKLSAFEENILRAYNDALPPCEGKKKDDIDYMASVTFDMLISRGQMPNLLRVDYIKKVLERFKSIGVLSV